MQIEINSSRAKEGYYTVTPHGPVDSDTYLDFQSKINPVLTPSTKTILLDLKDVDYISSAGLGVLFSVKKSLLNNKGELLFCNLKPQITKLFEIVRALPKESIFDNIQQVDEYLYKMMNQEIEKQRGKKNN